MLKLIKVMIILTLLSEISKKSFEIDRCNSEINREPINAPFFFFFQFSGSKYNYSTAHLGSPRGTPVAEHCSSFQDLKSPSTAALLALTKRLRSGMAAAYCSKFLFRQGIQKDCLHIQRSR